MCVCMREGKIGDGMGSVGLIAARLTKINKNTFFRFVY